VDRRSIGAIAILGLGIVLAGCSGAQQPAAVDKAGSQTLRLQFWTYDGTQQADQPPGPKAFLDSLAALSGGQIQVDFQTYFDGNEGDWNETALVKAIASGKVDGGFPTARAFAPAGFPGLQALEAPMTVTSYAAVKDLVSGPVAKDLLAQLNGTGVVGLGLAAGPLRRPFAAKGPLLEPDDWNGITFRAFNSPVQDATIHDLGGSPVDLGFNWVDDIASGKVQGSEFDIPLYLANGYTTEAPYVTANVVLWPKIFVLSVSQKLWDSLTDQQKGWIQAAAEAGTKASVDATYDETTTARALCDVGVRFFDATPAQLGALHRAVAPVINDLANDPVNGPLLSKVQQIAVQYATDVPFVPASCQTTALPTPSPLPSSFSSLPPGTYRVQVTLADVHNAGIYNHDELAGTATLVVNSDGTYTLACQAVSNPGTDCGYTPVDHPPIVEAGLVRGVGRTVTFVPDGQIEAEVQGCQLPVSDDDGHCQTQAPYSLDWSLDGTTLTFTNRGGTPSAGDNFSIKPWTKIG
jgi:TRAP-type C4-dicarboxylate transport system substrate-binding protein